MAGAVGIVPDYMGSDDYTIGAGPAGLMKFGTSDRYARVLVTELSVNVIDSRTWNFGPVLNYRLARDDVDDDAVDLMRDIDGTIEAGVLGGWTWIGDDDPRHRFHVSAEFLYDVGDTHLSADGVVVRLTYDGSFGENTALHALGLKGSVPF